MPSLTFHSIAARIPNVSGRIFIGFSGGIDSTVLLHLCATQATLKAKLVAVYVNHGLQSQADDWGDHCRQQAKLLGIEFINLRVDAKPAIGESPESAARNARYRAMQDLLEASDVLLFAQHREDQMETMLLQLFRGAGIKGLAAMPVTTAFGKGQLIRPLLDIAKADIDSFARQHALQWVEDPSNLSSDFDRNFLRNQITPLLKQRWPSLDKTVARSAQHCGEAMTQLDAWSKQLIEGRFDSTHRSLDIDNLQAFNEVQISWLLRQWFTELGLKPPSQALLQTFKTQLINARSDASPILHKQGYVFSKYRKQLFCLSEQQLIALHETCIWPADCAHFNLPSGYVLFKSLASNGIAKSLWDKTTVYLQPRSGSETLKLPGRAGQHSLKKLFQEYGIPPWERETRPLIYLDGKLAGVVGLWVAEWAFSNAPNDCYQVTWQPPKSV